MAEEKAMDNRSKDQEREGEGEGGRGAKMAMAQRLWGSGERRKTQGTSHGESSGSDVRRWWCGGHGREGKGSATWLVAGVCCVLRKSPTWDSAAAAAAKMDHE
jgi:hypothetical protein